MSNIPAKMSAVLTTGHGGYEVLKFSDDVEVPKNNLIGELNAGWTIAKKLLQHERAFISNFDKITLLLSDTL